MQTAYWQFCFCDRLTGARNPARLPTTIQSRRIRYAPTIGSANGRYYKFILPLPGTATIIEAMGERRNLLRTWFLRGLAATVLMAAAWAAPMTKINIIVKDNAGKPVDRASLIVRFVQGHSVVKLGKAIRTTYELRT